MWFQKKIRSSSIITIICIAYDRLVCFFRIKLTKGEASRIATKIYKNGFVQIDDFLSTKECNKLEKEFEKNISLSKIYENDYRIFGMQHISKTSKNMILNSSLIDSVASMYCGQNYITETLMFGKISYDGKINFGSGGGLHRDSFSNQLKAIIYLTDVTSKNGPFQYLSKSNNFLYLLRSIFKFKKKTRFDNDDHFSNLKTLDAKSGTLLIFDSRGLHKGKSLEEGYRLAATAYFINDTYHVPNNSISKLDNATFNSLNENVNIEV